MCPYVRQMCPYVRQNVPINRMAAGGRREQRVHIHISINIHQHEKADFNIYSSVLLDFASFSKFRVLPL